MEDVERGRPTEDEKDIPRPDETPSAAEAAVRQTVARLLWRQDEEALDEALLESFPASDAPSTWAGP